MNFKELLDTYQAEAILNRFEPTYEYTWRKFCRQYSKTFHTPLAQVLEMSPEDVIKAVYEEQMADVNIEENIELINDSIQSMLDPNYEVRKEKELEDELEDYERKEQERLERGESIMQSVKRECNQKNTPEKEEEETEFLPPEGVPKSGFVDLSYFSNDEET